ncbi:MAG TPA: TAT-variant-translocated molybdopterin oxidoreductase [Terriglobales bacterium]|nr:TAT-variant-translocated molybdopterin oxidoreductase [Terriglobales bacterium]
MKNRSTENMATDGPHNVPTPKPGNDLVQIGAPPAKAPKLELEAVRQQLSTARGPQYWRSLEELADHEGFAEMMEREFPRHVSEWTDAVSRRGFLKLMSASLALAGLSACTKQPDETIVPYVQQPEELIPGVPQYYATARPSAMGAQPLLVKSHMYRPIKVEGNPEHASSRGASDVYSQASVLDVYDPDRSQTITYLGNTRTWGDFLGALRDAAGGEKAKQGTGLRFLTETVTSPTLAAQFRQVLAAFPQARLYQYEPVNRDSARAGSRLAFGQYVDAQYQLENADVIVSLDADFLGGPYFPNFLKLAKDFAGRRKLDGKEMNRLYVVESQMSPTGGKADNRLALRAWEVEQFAAALAGAVGAGGNGTVDSDAAKRFMSTLAADLKAHSGRCVVIPGEQQTPAVHALAAAMNSALGAVGKTVIYTDTVEPVPSEQMLGIKELVDEMKAGKVSLLVMLGGNPVFNVPADLDLKGGLEKVPLRIQLSAYKDETSRYCHWQVAQAHYLESWSDARAFDGTVTVVQPLIEPLYGGRTAHDILGILSETPGQSSYDLVKAYWKSQSKAADFDAEWRRILHDGFVAGSQFPAKTVSAKAVAVPAPAKKDQLEIVFRPDPSIYDGRYINNGWLQELAKPITKLTWDNAVLMSYNYAIANKYHDQQTVEINVGGRKVKGGVKIVPGHPDGSITVHLGYGREFTGRVGAGTGFNAYALRTGANANTALGATLTPVDGKWQLAVTQHHHLIEGNHVINADLAQGQSLAGEAAVSRGMIRSAVLEEFEKNPNFANEGAFEAPPLDMTLFGENGHYSWTTDPAKTSAHQWGMTIDLNSCVGCNTCVIACQAENNIPVVGKEQVLMGREMQWLRIDAYFQSAASDVANPRLYFQPVPCMHCENAPCEPVCPVGATVHSPEGLNNMVYNRCVGTRYCSNNCPYKVRRFNFLLYADFDTESLKGVRNPDVSVRSRGVMEKCTYCVQRITGARIQAEKEDRKVRDGEVVTACQQACPTDAIVFGDMNDPNSRVNKIKKQQRNYAMLAEVNTRPRTTYVASVLNPNMQLENRVEKKSEHGG